MGRAIVQTTGHGVKRGDVLLIPPLGTVKKVHGRTSSVLVDIEGDAERHRIEHDAKVKVSRNTSSRRRDAPVAITVRSEASADKFAARAKLMERVRQYEYQFTQKPTHDNAAQLAGLRAALTEIELEIVDLNLSELVGE